MAVERISRNHGKKARSKREAVVIPVLVVMFLVSWTRNSGIVESWTPVSTGTRKGWKVSRNPHQFAPMQQQQKQQQQSRSEQRRWPANLMAHRFDDLTFSDLTETEDEKPSINDRLDAAFEFVDNFLLKSENKTWLVRLNEELMEAGLDEENGHYPDGSEFFGSDNGSTKRGSSPAPSVERMIYNPLQRTCSSSWESREKESFTDGTTTLVIRSNEPVLNASAIDAVRSYADAVLRQPDPDGIIIREKGAVRIGTQSLMEIDFLGEETPVGYRAISHIQEAVEKHIYPMVRENFLVNPDDKNVRFYVNSAQISRYNASSAEYKPTPGIGTKLFVQPDKLVRYNASDEIADFIESPMPAQGLTRSFHQDAFAVSVNIMLNDHSEFEGGGTFLENQLLQEEDLGDAAAKAKPLVPKGAGYCLAHKSNERHAGAATTAGNRDIIVLFLNAVVVDEDNNVALVPPEIMSLRVDQYRREDIEDEESAPHTDHERLLFQRMIGRSEFLVDSHELARNHSTESVLNSGGVNFCQPFSMSFLGSLLMHYADDVEDPLEAWSVRKVGLELNELVAMLSPCNPGSHGELGLRLKHLAMLVREEDDFSAEAAQRSSMELQESLFATFRGNEVSSEAKKTPPAKVLSKRARILVEKAEESFRRAVALAQYRAAVCNESGNIEEWETTTWDFANFLAEFDRQEEAYIVFEPVARRFEADDRGVESDMYKSWKSWDPPKSLDPGANEEELLEDDVDSEDTIELDPYDDDSIFEIVARLREKRAKFGAGVE